MKVRIRFGKSAKVRRNSDKIRRLALLAGALLAPAALAAWILALWRIAADLSWTSQFAILSGPFSYWQVWVGVGVLLQWCSRILQRYGKGYVGSA
jgi:hypothetical protein